MRLSIFAEDSRIPSHSNGSLLSIVDYSDDAGIPWKIIHEAERFLHLKIVICDSHANEVLMNNYHLDRKIEECLSNCSSQREFLNILHDSVIEWFGDCLNVDTVDAAFYRSELPKGFL